MNSSPEGMNKSDLRY